MHRTLAILSSLSALFAAGAMGCSSTPSSSPAQTEGGGCDTTTPVSFSSDVIPVFQKSCTLSDVCHGQMNSAAEEDLYLGEYMGTTNATTVYSMLVGVPAKEDPVDEPREGGQHGQQLPLAQGQRRSGQLRRRLLEGVDDVRRLRQHLAVRRLDAVPRRVARDELAAVPLHDPELDPAGRQEQLAREHGDREVAALVIRWPHDRPAHRQGDRPGGGRRHRARRGRRRLRAGRPPRHAGARARRRRGARDALGAHARARGRARPLRFRRRERARRVPRAHRRVERRAARSRSPSSARSRRPSSRAPSRGSDLVGAHRRSRASARRSPSACSSSSATSCPIGIPASASLPGGRAAPSARGAGGEARSACARALTGMGFRPAEADRAIASLGERESDAPLAELLREALGAAREVSYVAGPMKDVIAFIDANRKRFVDELVEWVRIPSISSDPAHAADVAAERRAPRGASCAALGAGRVEVWPTRRASRRLRRVAAARRASRRSSSTATTTCSRSIRSSEWIIAALRAGRSATGASGVAASSTTRGRSTSTRRRSRASCRRRGQAPDQPEAHRRGRGGDRQREPRRRSCASSADDLAADFVCVSDTAMFGRGIPSLCVGLRGLAYLEVFVDGPARDLHSGSFGGGVLNPINALAKMIATLHDDDGRDHRPRASTTTCSPLTAPSAREIARLPFDEKEWLQSTGAPARLRARRATRRSSASGRGRRSTAAASAAASRARARRRSSRRGRARR